MRLGVRMERSLQPAGRAPKTTAVRRRMRYYGAFNVTFGSSPEAESALMEAPCRGRNP